MAEESITDILYLVRSLQAKIDEMDNKIDEMDNKIKLLERENSFLCYKLHQADLENKRFFVS